MIVLQNFVNHSTIPIRDLMLLLAQGDAGDAADAPPSFFREMLNSPFLLIGGLLALFYVIVLLPEKRKKREAAERLSQLKKNDRVITIGGIHGTIVSANSDSGTVTIRTDESGTNRLRVSRSAIATVIDEPSSGETKEKKDKTEK